MLYSKKNGEAYCQKCNTKLFVGKKFAKAGDTVVCPSCGHKMTCDVWRLKYYSQTGVGVIPDNEDGKFVLRYFFIYKQCNGKTPETFPIKYYEVVREYYDNKGNFKTYEMYDEKWKRCRLKNNEYYYSYYSNRMLGMHTRMDSDFSAIYTSDINKHKNDALKYIDLCKMFKNFEMKSWLTFHAAIIDVIKCKEFFEYTQKCKFNTLLRELLYRWIEIDTTKKSHFDMLKISKEQYKTLDKKSTIDDILKMRDINTYHLRNEEEYQLFVKHLKHCWNKNQLIELMPMTIYKFGKYMETQAQNANYYYDYLRMSQELGLDLKNTFVSTPKDLKASHDMVTDMYNEMKFDIKLKNLAEEANKRASEFAPVVERCKEYEYEDGDYEVVAPKSAFEIGNEGFKLRHCVAMYIGDIITGSKNILFLRKKSEPDVPFYTIEIIENMITQCKSYRNSPRTAPVEEFLQKFAKNFKLTIDKKEHFAAMV